MKRLSIAILSGLMAVSLFAAPQSAKAQNIVDVALQVNADTGEFSTLIAALQATGLVPVVANLPQITVFAPTDAAFAQLGITADNVRLAPRDLLARVLLYHVTLGARDAASVTSSRFLLMAAFEFARVRVTDAGAFINSSQIVATDVPASNGFIHVIDSVLVPPSLLR